MVTALAHKFSLQVRGVSFTEGYPDNLREIATWLQQSRGLLPARLVRNPNNPYDSNAVEVHIGTHMIGHVNADIAARLAPELDAGIVWRATVKEINGSDDTLGCKIECARAKTRHDLILNVPDSPESLLEQAAHELGLSPAQVSAKAMSLLGPRQGNRKRTEAEVTLLWEELVHENAPSANTFTA